MYEVQTLGELPGLKGQPWMGIPSDWLPPGFVPPPGVHIIPAPEAPARSSAPPVAALVAGGVALVALGALGTWLVLRR